tara:strand:- start:232 stop:1887 length:1656 start_codon:yes stop_codon:yes gene_type:complete
MELFGYKIEKKIGSNVVDKGTTSFVAPDLDDGSTVIDGGGVNAFAVNFDTAFTTQQDLIAKYRQTAKQPEAESAIDDIVNEAIVLDPYKEPVQIYLDKLDSIDGFSKSIKTMISDEFQIISKKLEFNQSGPDIFRRWYEDGAIHYHIIFDNDNLKKGIKELRYIDSTNIKKIKEVIKDKDKNGVEVVIGVDEYWLYSKESKGITQTLKVALEAVATANSGLYDSDKEVIMSYLHKAMKPINQLRMLEDAMVIYRITRAPERRVFYIDVGNLPKTKAEQYLRNIMNKFKNKMVYDASTGTVADGKDTMSMMEDFWLPRKEGGRGTEVQTLPGGQNLGDMEDVNYFQRKVYQALHVPSSRMDTEQTWSISRSGEITRDEIKFGKYVTKLRKSFSDLLYSLLRTQLLAKGIIDKGEWNVYKENINFIFEDDGYFTEVKKLEMMQSRIEMLDTINSGEMIGKYYSVEWIRKNILMQSEDEIDAMDKQMEKEAKEAEEDGEEYGSDGNQEEEEDDGYGSYNDEPAPAEKKDKPEPKAAKDEDEDESKDDEKDKQEK